MVIHNPPQPVADAVIDLKEVQALTSISKASIYRLMKSGRFPAAKILMPGSRRVGWLKSDVLQWVAEPLDWGDEIAF